MNFEIHITPTFHKELKALAKRHKSIKQDFSNFVKYIRENPFQGVELYPGIRKIRMAISSKGRGKSGGARVITYTILVTESSGDIYFMDIYDKADHSTIDVAIVKKAIADLNLTQ